MNQPMQLPASIANRPRRGTLAAMTQGLGISSPPRVSIKAQRFTLIDSSGSEINPGFYDNTVDPATNHPVGIYLDAVIIDVNPHPSKQFYEFEYSPDRDDAPACWSDNGVAPSSQAEKPQSPTCAACPNNAWGSATSKMTGKPTKACSDRKKMAILVPGDPAQLAYQFVIPPASLKNLRAYADTLKGHQVQDAEGPRAADPADIVTRIYFNPLKQGELLFKGIGFVDDGIVVLTQRAYESGVTDILTGRNDQPFQGALPPPAPVQQLEAPIPRGAPEMQAPPNPQPTQQFQQPNFAPTQQANGSAPPLPPAPRSRRGGARAGAGRPPDQAPAQAPSVAPFAPSAAPFAAPSVPQAPVPTAATTSPSSGPVPFAPRAAAPVAPEMPAFLQRPQPAAPQAPAPQGTPAFGMASAPQPSPELTAAVERAFTTPLTPRAR